VWVLVPVPVSVPASAPVPAVSVPVHIYTYTHPYIWCHLQTISSLLGNFVNVRKSTRIKTCMYIHVQTHANMQGRGPSD